MTIQKYDAKFYGRQRGAIGIMHECRCFTEGETIEQARLKLYDDYEHITGLTLVPLVLRYVVTNLNDDGIRTLTFACQGRETFETEAQAEAALTMFLQGNAPHVITPIWGPNPQFEVRPCWCWPGHFNPIGVYFDGDTPVATVAPPEIIEDNARPRGFRMQTITQAEYRGWVYVWQRTGEHTGHWMRMRRTVTERIKQL